MKPCYMICVLNSVQLQEVYNQKKENTGTLNETIKIKNYDVNDDIKIKHNYFTIKTQ